VLKYSEVGEILSLIDSSSCDEVILETDGIKLVVRRGGTATASGGHSPQPAAVQAQASSPSAAAPATPKPAAGGDGFVGAPMVGTFYRAPSPEDPPYVEVGSKVNVGDPICVIEVMKLFTTVHAEVAGTVTQIGVADAQLVEFGQMIFMIETA
tara:strand:+ start:159 stop:617 length:459 start_codon:yes stop_codon:yes gene_type:complete